MGSTQHHHSHCKSPYTWEVRPSHPETKNDTVLMCAPKTDLKQTISRLQDSKTRAVSSHEGTHAT
eukprot:3539981-Amphidinium_carterae.1